MNVYPIYPADDGLGCCRGLMFATIAIPVWCFILIAMILAAPVKVGSDDFRPRKEYRMELNHQALKAHGFEVTK